MRRHLLEIVPGTKYRPCGIQHDSAHLRIAGNIVECKLKRLQHRLGQGIALVWLRQCQKSNATGIAARNRACERGRWGNGLLYRHGNPHARMSSCDAGCYLVLNAGTGQEP